MRKGRLIPQWTETRLARDDHECDYCNGRIAATCEYHREVRVYGSEFVVTKRHEAPDCEQVHC